MNYFGELRANWRWLAAAALGMAFGNTLTNYTNNVFVPALMKDFGWSNAQIALLGLAALMSIVAQPLAGRLTDRWGVRPVAFAGIVSGALVFAAYSRMDGAFATFLGLVFIQIALFAAMTGPVVYSRLIAQSFDKARGMALGIAACAPSIAGALIVPVLAPFIEREGWRTGYLLVAGYTLLAGFLALLLIPRRQTAERVATAEQGPADYRAIFANPAFWPIVLGIVLCSLTIVMQTTQLNVILRENGLSSGAASSLISVYAIGVIVGRLACGVALDRYPAHKVALIAMGLPAAGLAILASGANSVALQGLAVLLIGASLGAETDVAGFMVMRYFPVGVYSAVLGLLLGALSGSSALGSLILSGTLKATGEFAPFLWFAALSTLAGSWQFWRLGRLSQETPVRTVA